MGKKGSFGSLGSGDHVGALGLAGDLAVVEKSSMKVVSVVRTTTLTRGAHCQRHNVSLLFFYSNPDFWHSCKNHISIFVDPKIVKLILWCSLRLLVFIKNIKCSMFSEINNY